MGHRARQWFSNAPGSACRWRGRAPRDVSISNPPQQKVHAAFRAGHGGSHRVSGQISSTSPLDLAADTPIGAKNDPQSRGGDPLFRVNERPAGENMESIADSGRRANFDLGDDGSPFVVPLTPLPLCSFPRAPTHLQARERVCLRTQSLMATFPLVVYSRRCSELAAVLTSFIVALRSPATTRVHPGLNSWAALRAPLPASSDCRTLRSEERRPECRPSWPSFPSPQVRPLIGPPTCAAFKQAVLC